MLPNGQLFPFLKSSGGEEKNCVRDVSRTRAIQTLPSRKVIYVNEWPITRWGTAVWKE